MGHWVIDHFYNWLCGIFFATIGYFTEIQGAVHVMWAALALDLMAGILASVLKRKEKFCMVKAFTAVVRAIGATVLVDLLFAMDTEMHQDVTETCNIAAWLIAGFYAWSISENMDQLTGGRIFKILAGFIEKKVEDTAGIDLKAHEAPLTSPQMWGNRGRDGARGMEEDGNLKL